MFTFGISTTGQAFDPLILLILAIILDTYLGDMNRLFRVIKHPIVVIGNAITFFDNKLNREKRSNIERRVRGGITVLIMVSATGFIGVAVTWLSVHHPMGWVIELLLISILLAGRSLYDHVKTVAMALTEGLEPGRRAVSHIVGRDPAHLDQHGVARASIESLAENLCDGVIAPVFWYLLLGFPGLLVYKTVNTMDSMIGYKNTKYRAFGMVAARLDDALNFIPARLTGLFLILAAFFAPTASPAKAFRAMMRDSGKHKSMNAGWPEAAMAGALNIALAGPRRYSNTVVDDPWMGDGSAKVTMQDIERALYMYTIANLINVIWVAAIAVVRFGTS
jgi:adenosylcobinamide-phosphate synthase